MIEIDRKGWNALKAAQKPKIPDGVSSVNIGSALDKYHAAANKGGRLATVKPLSVLVKACATYKADLKKKYPTFVRVFETNVEAPFLEKVHILEELSHVPAFMKTAIKEMTNSLAELAKKQDRATYMKAVGAFNAMKLALEAVYEMDKAEMGFAPKYKTAMTKAFDRDTRSATPDDYKQAAAHTGLLISNLIVELKKRSLYS